MNNKYKNHAMFEFDLGDCKVLLQDIIKGECTRFSNYKEFGLIINSVALLF